MQLDQYGDGSSIAYLNEGATSLSALTSILDSNQDGALSHNEFIVGIKSKKYQRAVNKLRYGGDPSEDVEPAWNKSLHAWSHHMR